MDSKNVPEKKVRVPKPDAETLKSRPDEKNNAHARPLKKAEDAPDKAGMGCDSENDLFRVVFPVRWKSYVNWLLAIAAFLSLYLLVDVLTPFVLAFFGAYVLNPVVVYFERLFKNKAAAIIIVYILLFGLFLILVIPLTTNIINEVGGIPEKMKTYGESFKKMYRNSVSAVDRFVSSESIKGWLNFIGDGRDEKNGGVALPAGQRSEEPSAVASSDSKPVELNAPELLNYRGGTAEARFLATMKSLMKDNPKAESFVLSSLEMVKDSIIATATAILMGILNLLFALIHYAIVPVLCFYFLEDFKLIWEGFSVSIPPKVRKKTVKMVTDIDIVLGTFLRGQLIVCLIVGTLFSVTLFFIGVDFALIIGPISGAFNIIPYLGPVVALVPSMVLALLKWGFTFVMVKKIILIFVLVILVHLIDAFLMQPMVAGQSFEIHSLTLMALLFIGFKVYGILGMFLAIPVYGVGKVIYRNFDFSYE